MKKLNIISTLNIKWNKKLAREFITAMYNIEMYVTDGNRNILQKGIDWLMKTEPFKSFFKVKSVRRIEIIKERFFGYSSMGNLFDDLFEKGYIKYEREYWGGTRIKEDTSGMQMVLDSIGAQNSICFVIEFLNVWGISIKALKQLVSRDQKKILSIGWLDDEVREVQADFIEGLLVNFEDWEYEREVIFHKPIKKLKLSDIIGIYDGSNYYTINEWKEDYKEIV